MAYRITRDFVLKKLVAVFPDRSIAQLALKSLDTYGNSEYQPHKEEVHLAILKLCEGRLSRLRELVREAKHDYRDVTYPALTPEYSRVMRELIPDITRGLTAKERDGLKKKMSPAKEAAIRKRDQEQWIAWVTDIDPRARGSGDNAGKNPGGARG
jgi:hypothetical protein